MAASSADEMRDKGEHSDWPILHNLHFVLLLSQEIENMISLRSQLGKLLLIVASTCQRIAYYIFEITS